MAKSKKRLLQVALWSFLQLGSTGLQAANPTWVGGGTPSNSDLAQSNNWVSSTPPTSSTIAEFNTSTYTSPSTGTGSLNALGILFDASAPAYTITADPTYSLNIGTSGVVNNSTTTQLLQTSGSGTITIAAVPGGVNSAGENVNYNIGVGSTTGGSLTFAGATSSLGQITIYGSNTFNVNGNSTIGQLNSDYTDANTILNGSLTITTMNSVPYVGSISGPGAFIVSAYTATPFEYMYIEGPNTYTGGTVLNAGIAFLDSPLPVNGPLTINGGTLTVDENQVVGNLSGTGGSIYWYDAVSTVQVNQTSNATWAGSLVSPSAGGSFTLGTTGSSTATGTLQLTGNSAFFAGNVIVDSGNLQVNGSLGALSIAVNAGGTLSGTGTVGTAGNTVTINSGGKIAPGNSVGVLTNLGNQVFNAGSIFELEENGLTSTPTPPGSNSLLIVNGTTTVGTGGAATVHLFPTTTDINLNTKQAFIESAGGLTVTTPFNLDTSALVGIFNPATINPLLSYDANNYYITTQTTFTSAVTDAGGNKNSIVMAEIFDSITDPNTPQNLFLNELAQLPTTDDLIEVLDDISGAQYATDLFAAETSNRKFLRRLYDPIRYLVTTEPNRCCECECNPCCETMGLDVWASAGGGQSQVNGHHGAKLNEWDVTIGAQTTFMQAFTVGIAGSYEKNYLNYHHSHGRGNGHTWFGGVYGLYRPECYYVLADIAYSNTERKTHRHLVIGDVVDHFKSKPQLQQVTFYAEAGFDYSVCSFLIQPFVGIEVAGVNRKGFRERDLDLSDLALDVKKHNRTAAISSLGVHLTDQFDMGFSLSVDLAWLYRFTNNNHFDAYFVSIPAGTFDVYGNDFGRNSGEGAITFMKEFSNNWNIFVEASGEIWSNASTYNILGGAQVTW